MGRPLYSLSIHPTPVVRVEPEQPPSCTVPEKWSYWNQFDPDADEFFESDQAVYEAFVDSAQLPLQDAADERHVEIVDDRSSSSSSSSGRGSPMEQSEDAPADLVDTRIRGDMEGRGARPSWMEGYNAPRRLAAEVFEPPRARSESPGPDEAELLPFLAHRPSEIISTYANMFRMASEGTVTPSSATHAAREHVLPALVPPAPSPSADPPSRSPSPFLDPVSPPRRARTLSGTQPVTPTPSTPPSQFSQFYGSPSPAPTVTPRLYTWSSRNPMASLPASPSAPGPFTNRNARLSLAHIPPAPSLVTLSRAA